MATRKGASKSTKPLSLLERLMSPASRNAYLKRSKLDEMKIKLNVLKLKLAVIPKGFVDEKIDDSEAYRREIAELVLTENKEKYAEKYKDCLAKSKDSRGYAVLAQYDEETFSWYEAYRDALNHPTYLSKQADTKKYRDTESKMLALQRAVDTTEFAMDMKVETVPGLGQRLLAVLPSLNVKSGIMLPNPEGPYRLFPENKKAPEDIWCVAHKSYAPFVRVDVETDAVVFDCDEETAELVGPFLAEFASLGNEALFKWGKLFKICVVCHLPLTDPVSLERGMGEVCFKRFG